MGLDPDVRAFGVEPLTMPSDWQRLVLTVLFAGWALAFGFSFAVYEASSVEPFLGWQLIAGLLAYAVFVVSRDWPKGVAVRQLGWVPIVAALFVVAIALSLQVYVA